MWTIVLDIGGLIDRTAVPDDGEDLSSPYSISRGSREGERLMGLWVARYLFIYSSSGMEIGKTIRNHKSNIE